LVNATDFNLARSLAKGNQVYLVHLRMTDDASNDVSTSTPTINRIEEATTKVREGGDVTNRHPDVSNNLPPEMKKLLGEFRDVFPSELPKGIPPSRNLEHKIQIVPGSEPPIR
jgi:hypothetical protein